MCVILHMSVITQGGDSALMIAAREGKTEVVVQLVKAGANVDMQNRVCQYFSELANHVIITDLQPIQICSRSVAKILYYPLPHTHVCVYSCVHVMRYCCV